MPTGQPADNPFAPTRSVARRLLAERVAQVIFSIMAISMIIPLVLIVVVLFYEAWPSLSWEFLSENPSRGMRAGGIWSAILGTLYLIFFSVLFTAPIGILAGIYLNEFAKDNWFSRSINLAVVNLAGVPSVVYGLFGFGAFVLAAGFGKSIISASLTLGIMTLPVIITATREALNAVPMPFREACWSMGASKWQTIRTIVLPNSLSGVLTGVILEVCRVAGETAPILFTGAVFYKAIDGKGLFAYSPTEQCMALSYHLHTIATQVPGVPESIQYGTAVVLIGLILIVNSVAVTLRVYLRSRKRW